MRCRTSFLICTVLLLYLLECVAAYEIIVFHPRKASGTTVLRWMQEFGKQLQTIHKCEIEIIHIEGWPYVHGQNRHGSVIDYYKKKYKNALFVMTFREPIDRILSQYEFEWRWLCQHCSKFEDLDYLDINEGNYMQWSEDKAKQGWPYKYKFSNLNMREFLQRIEKYELNNTKYGESERRNVYLCYLYNYYLWLFCCDSEYCKVADIIAVRDCLSHAQSVLDSFDLILISEWLRDQRTMLYTNRIIHAYFAKHILKNASIHLPNIAIPHRWSWLHNGSSYNRMIPNQIFEKLTDWNKWDLQFYDYAKKKAYHRIHSSYLNAGRMCANTIFVLAISVLLLLCVH